MSAAFRTVARSAFRTPHTFVPRRTLVTIKDRIYTATATTGSTGRNGYVSSPNERPLKLDMSMPKALGGAENGHNPEQLFAMGYASCFSGALNLAALRLNKKDAIANAKIHVDVHLGKLVEGEGFGLEAEIKVEGVQDDAVLELAHQVRCFSCLTAFRNYPGTDCARCRSVRTAPSCARAPS
ncbi:OsmC-like protein [Amylostereum chailletii]|nr:OsmC-like protein [Amylostereum chailletii]